MVLICKIVTFEVNVFFLNKKKTFKQETRRIFVILYWPSSKCYLNTPKPKFLVAICFKCEIKCISNTTNIFSDLYKIKQKISTHLYLLIIVCKGISSWIQSVQKAFEGRLGDMSPTNDIPHAHRIIEAWPHLLIGSQIGWHCLLSVRGLLFFNGISIAYQNAMFPCSRSWTVK